MNETTDESLPVSAELLEILRDPQAVQEPEKYGPDPGRLQLVHNAWLVSEDTGYKYPIKDGIPVMLIEEGKRWKDTPIDELPLPPETADPLPDPASQPDDPSGARAAGGPDPKLILLLAGLGALFGLALVFWRRRGRGNAGGVSE